MPLFFESEDYDDGRIRVIRKTDGRAEITFITNGGSEYKTLLSQGETLELIFVMGG